MTEGRDVWWHDIVERQRDRLPAGAGRLRAHALPAVHLGHHGQAQGHHPHHRRATCWARSYTHEIVFDIKPDDVYWCAADIGWVTGHSYIVYGPLANATTGVMYEGAPDTPAWDRWWQIVEKYKVTILYCAPTAIRAFMKQGEECPRSTICRRCGCWARWASRSTPRRGSGTTSNIGGERCPIVDTWWQTETGMILITPLPGRDRRPSRAVPRSRSRASPRTWSTRTARAVPLGGGGYLVLKRPWPAMLRGIYGDPERYRATYWGRFPGMYFAGDGAKRDDDGYFWLLGRVDDVMNIAGHRISHHRGRIGAGRPSRAWRRRRWSGKNDPMTGQAIFAFVTISAGIEPTSDALADELREHVAKVIGPIAQPQVPAVHAGPAQDALGQDHAAPAARRRRGPAPGRHHDARGRGRRRHASGQERGRPRRTRSPRMTAQRIGERSGQGRRSGHRVRCGRWRSASGSSSWPSSGSRPNPLVGVPSSPWGSPLFLTGNMQDVIHSWRARSCCTRRSASPVRRRANVLVAVGIVELVVFLLATQLG